MPSPLLGPTRMIVLHTATEANSSTARGFIRAVWGVKFRTSNV